MARFLFNKEKDAWLRANRGIGFKEVIQQIEGGSIVAVIDNPNQDRYPGQRMYLVNIRSYVYVVPFVRELGYIWLKTIYRSRKMTKHYLREKKHG